MPFLTAVMNTAAAQEPLMKQVLRCLVTFVIYVLPCLAILVPVRFLTKLPSFVFRKLLHFIAFSCVTLMILTAPSWQAAAILAVLIAVALYPVLGFLENKPWFGKLFVQKSPGEIKRSLLMLMFMFAALIAVSWGIFGEPVLAAAAILMWGTGDAAAALVGIPLGKHKVRCRFTDGKKSWEGTGAMFLTAFISGMLVLCLAQKTPFPQALPAVLAAAVLGAATELFSPSEVDTVTVPVVILAVLLIAGV